MSLEYSCERAIVGSGLPALLEAFSSGTPLILTDVTKPHPFELLAGEESLEAIGFPQGSRKLDLYNFLLFNLSVAGLAPFAGEVATVREVEGGLAVVSESTLDCKVVVPTILYITPQVCQEQKVVLDWINVRRGQKHDLKQIKTTSDFVSCVYFYPSFRVDGSVTSNLNDAVSISYMSSKEILNSNYSEFYVRMKVKSLMEDEGIRGPKNGKDPRDASKQKYHSILLESDRREVYPLTTSKLKVPETYSILPVVSHSQENP